MSIQLYKQAVSPLRDFATGKKRVVITAIEGRNDVNVGLYIDTSSRYQSQSTFRHNDSERSVARDVMRRVIDKLEPAIQSLFQRCLADRLEELRVNALAHAELIRSQELEKQDRMVAEMSRPFDAEPETET